MNWLKKKYEYIARKSESQLQTEKEKEMKRRLTTLASELSEVDKGTIVEKYQGEVHHVYTCDNLTGKWIQ